MTNFKILKSIFLLPYLVILILSLDCNHRKESSFEFQRLTFHALGEGCEGFCSTFHMQIDSNRQLLFYGEKVYKTVDSLEKIPISNQKSKIKYRYQNNTYRIIDNTKTGYFIGKVSVPIYTELIRQLKAIDLDSLKMDGNQCCDGIHKKLTVFYNRKSKYWEATFPEENVEKFFTTLYKIVESSKLKRTKSEIKIN